MNEKLWQDCFIREGSRTLIKPIVFEKVDMERSETNIQLTLEDKADADNVTKMRLVLSEGAALQLLQSLLALDLQKES